MHDKDYFFDIILTMTIINHIVQLFYKSLDFIYKKKCYFCNSSRECVRMCSKCYDELQHTDIRINRVLNQKPVYSAGVYEKNLQKMIRGIKYHRQKELGFYMAKFMYEYFSQVIAEENLPKDYQVVPVPLHPKRKRKRGYNHMEIVAKEFCELSGFELNTDLIKRVKSTKPQYKLSFSEKMKNMENAFKAEKNQDKNKPVLIIDDICTSGATFTSMITELQNNGITDIYCLSASSPE